MNAIPAITLAASLVLCAAPSSAQSTEGSRSGGNVAIGKLMAFVHGAAAFKFECALATGSGEFDQVFDNWVARNERLIDRIDEAGRSAAWFNSDGFGPSEYWNRMLRRDATRTMRQVAELIKANPGEACGATAKSFDVGDFDLARFPDDLKAIGVRVP